MPIFATFRDVARLTSELNTANARVASLELELKEERIRHLKREDELVDRLCQKQGTFGLAAPTSAPRVTKPDPPAEPKLTAMEEAKLNAYMDEAPSYGYSRQQGAELFWAQKAGKAVSFDLPPMNGQVEWQQ